MPAPDSRPTNPPPREDERRFGEFLAKLVHDLRDPLTPVLGALQLAEQLSGEERQAEVRKLIGRQLENLVGKVDDLGELARLLLRDLPLDRQRMDLNDVVRAALEATRTLRERTGHTVDFQLPEGPRYLEADYSRMLRALVGILETSFSLCSTAGRIHLRVAGRGGWAVVRVVTTESDIRLAEPSRLFDFFYRIHREKSGTQGNAVSRLGEAKAVVELHGGGIRVYRTGKRGGVAVTVCLPL